MTKIDGFFIVISFYDIDHWEQFVSVQNAVSLKSTKKELLNNWRNKFWA